MTQLNVFLIEKCNILLSLCASVSTSLWPIPAEGAVSPPSRSDFSSNGGDLGDQLHSKSP